MTPNATQYDLPITVTGMVGARVFYTTADGRRRECFIKAISGGLVYCTDGVTISAEVFDNLPCIMGC